MLKQKIKEWLKRYLPAEIVGTLTAVGAASITHVLSDNHLLIAYIGSLGEAVGFYSTVFIQQIITAGKHRKIKNEQFSLADAFKIITNLVLEFGPAGMIDGFVLRPFFMYFFPMFLKNFTLGILLGKIAGDITFYMLVIFSYEMKKHVRKNENT